jgi:hypothetical protein
MVIYEVDSHISNPWSHAQPTHVVQGRGTKHSIRGWYTSKIFHALSQSLDPTFLYSNTILLILVFCIICSKRRLPYTWYQFRCWVYHGDTCIYNVSTSLQYTFFHSGFLCYDHPCSFLLPQRLKLL